MIPYIVKEKTKGIMKNVLILGASGLIGTALYNEMIGMEEYNVWGTVKSEDGVRTKENGCLAHWDIYEKPEDTWIDLTIDYDCIIVCAWDGNQRAKRDDLEVNKRCADRIYSFLEYVSKRCKINQIILCGSQAEYGIVESTIYENVIVDKKILSAYGWSKLYLYERLKDASFCNILTELRFHSVYGYQKKSEQMIIRVIDNLLQDREVVLNTDCKQRSNFIHVDDVAEAIIVSMNLKIEGCFNIGVNQDNTLRDYIMQVAEGLGKEHLIRFGCVTMPETGFFCSDEFRKVSGWKERTDFKHGIQEIAYLMRGDNV